MSHHHERATCAWCWPSVQFQYTGELCVSEIKQFDFESTYRASGLTLSEFSTNVLEALRSLTPEVALKYYRAERARLLSNPAPLSLQASDGDLTEHAQSCPLETIE